MENYYLINFRYHEDVDIACYICLFQVLIIVAKHSFLDVAVLLHMPLLFTC